MTEKNNYRLFVDGKELSPYKYGSLEWSDNIDGVSTVFKFTSLLDFKLDDAPKFVLMNKQNELVRGLIVDKSYDKDLRYVYAGLDYGFHLNQNTITIQFKNINAKDAIVQLLKSIGVPAGIIDAMPATISEEYSKQSVASIIQDICEKTYKRTGKRYYIRIKSGKVNVRRFQYIKIANQLYWLNEENYIKISDTLSNFSVTESIREMKNSVQVTAKDGDKNYILATASNSGSIKKYGLLQTQEDQDKKNPKANKTIAKTTLEKLDRIKQTISLEMLGIDEIESGVILSFDNEIFQGDFLVTGSSHKIISEFNHKVSLEVERFVN